VQGKTEEVFPIGDDLIWYEMQMVVRDFDSLKWRVEKLGRQMQQNYQNHNIINDDLLRRVSALTAELAALKKE